MTQTEDPFFDLAEVRRFTRKWAIDCGAKVEGKRGERGWTRARFAQLVGTTEATIHRVETGVLAPRDYLKIAIAAALATPVADLWPYPDMATVFAAASTDAA